MEGLKERCGKENHSKEDRMVVQDAMEKMEMWNSEIAVSARFPVDSGSAFLLPGHGHPAWNSVSGRTYGKYWYWRSGQVYDLLKHLNEKIAIILASHDVMIISSHVKSVACVNQDVHYHDNAESRIQMMDITPAL